MLRKKEWLAYIDFIMLMSPHENHLDCLRLYLLGNEEEICVEQQFWWLSFSKSLERYKLRVEL